MGATETTFAREVFFPVHAGAADLEPIRYGPWALRFAVSVSWRVLTHYLSLGIDHLGAKQLVEAAEALEIWRQFLLGHAPHPGKYEQHLLPLDRIASFSGGSWSPFLNRYLLRTVEMDVVASAATVFVFAKLGRIVLLGFVMGAKRSDWKGTRLNANAGSVGGKTDYTLPANFAEYLDSKAARAAAALAELSPKQDALIEAGFRTNADAIARSEVFKAMQQDVLLFGERAFSVTRK